MEENVRIVMKLFLKQIGRMYKVVVYSPEEEERYAKWRTNFWTIMGRMRKAYEDDIGMRLSKEDLNILSVSSVETIWNAEADEEEKT